MSKTLECTDTTHPKRQHHHGTPEKSEGTHWFEHVYGNLGCEKRKDPVYARP